MNCIFFKSRKFICLLGLFLMISLMLQAQSVLVDSLTQHPQNKLQKHYINLRGNLNNSRFVFGNEREGRVAFLGGSITEMKGWHHSVMEYLIKRFPNTKFEFVEADVSAVIKERTCNSQIKTGPFNFSQKSFK